MHENHEIPKIVIFQFINFFGLLLILFVLLRKKVKAYFVKRHDDLTLALREAKKLKEEAEAKNRELNKKLKELEQGQEALLQQMRKEGESSKERLLAEARKIAESIAADAAKAAANEAEKAKAELYDEVLKQALEGARNILSKSVADKDQKRLQKEFVEKIEAVQ